MKTDPADSRLIAITHVPSPALAGGERTFIPRAPIDFHLAQRQHAAYCAILRECGATVTSLEANVAYPDCVFVEDTALVLDEVAIMARPGAPSRAAEPAGIEPELRRYREVRRLDAPATLDGGDVVVAGRSILVGASSRTNEEGALALARYTREFGYEVRRVPLRDCLHLKSACCALPDGRLLVNPSWLDSSVLDDFTLLHIPEAEPFAADFAAVGDTILVSASHPRTADQIRELGFPVRAAVLTEFEKAEGGVTCLSIIFRTT
jgi:dimethylargininase